MALHEGVDIDPDERDKADNSWVIKTVADYVATFIPGLESTPSVIETCIYTVGFLAIIVKIILMHKEAARHKLLINTLFKFPFKSYGFLLVLLFVFF